MVSSKYHFLLAAALASAALASPAAFATPKHHRFGAFDPVFTPFYANGTLNLAAVPGYAKWTTDCGTDTIILGGSTGEWPSMTSTERLATLRAWRTAIDALPPRTPPLSAKPIILFHAGDVALERAVTLASEAAAYADQLLVVAPCIMRPADNTMLTRVIGMVAAAAPKLPVWYYFYPKLYNVALPITPFLAAASKAIGGIPNLAGVKFIDSINSTDLANATTLLDRKYELITTSLLAGLERGLRGAIAYTAQAPFVNNATRAFIGGDRASAATLDNRSHALLEAFKASGSTKMGARYSSALFAPDLDLGPPRLPLEPLKPAQVATMKAALIAGGFL